MIIKLCLFSLLHKIAAGIIKHLWFNHKNALYFSLYIFHYSEFWCKDTAKKS